MILTYNNTVIVKPDVMVFNGGELNVTLPKVKCPLVHSVRIDVGIKNAEDIMCLLLCVDALRRKYQQADISLYMPYIPYARQDRVCNNGESLSIKVFADLINNCNFTEVIVLDPHSDVAPAILNNCRIIDTNDILKRRIWVHEFDALIAPDFGATKKLEKNASEFNLPLYQGFKKRDLKTGALSGFGVHGDITHDKVLIVDDICDGGGTFLGLAKEIRKKNPSVFIGLYVTHGIFSKTSKFLLDNGIDEIYTTDSFEQTLEPNKFIIKVGELL